MKRQDRLVDDQKQIDDIIMRSQVCRLGVYDGEEPYVIPMNFGYKDQIIYLHCAKRGRKVDILSEGSRICVEFDIMHNVKPHDEVACRWSISYESVIAWGTPIIIEDTKEKRMAMDAIMDMYSERGNWDYPDVAIKNTVMIKIKLEDASGKRDL